MSLNHPSHEQLVFVYNQPSGNKAAAECRWDSERNEAVPAKKPWQFVRELMLSSIREVICRKPQTEILTIGLDFDRPDEVVAFHRATPVDRQMIDNRLQNFDRWVKLFSEKYEKKRIRGSVSTFLWVEAPKATVAVWLECARRTKHHMRRIRTALGQSMVSLRWTFLGDDLAPATRAGSGVECVTELPMDEQIATLFIRELHLTPTISASLVLPNCSVAITVQPLGLPTGTAVYSSYDTLNFTALSRIRQSYISGALDYGYPLLARSGLGRFRDFLGALSQEAECIALDVSTGSLQPKTASMLACMGYDNDNVLLIGRPSSEGLLLKGLLDYRTTCAPFISETGAISDDLASDDNSVSFEGIPSDPLGDRTFFGILLSSTIS
ncbi:hypothetical protein FOZ60_015108 [Perkinsus olseni]|uniref:Uncharacterized protein n=2 Tax=Perkinsus olseni TaxID=32597 RepID=A0A7J6P7C8_PEROL|nr:hypothetical protein FOZ60_015108 [Perkinsus olseni]